MVLVLILSFVEPPATSIICVNSCIYERKFTVHSQQNRIKKLIVGFSTIVISILVENALVQAQKAPNNNVQNVQKQIIQLNQATLRTPEEMQRANVQPVNPPSMEIPFRTTIDPETYERLKKEAEGQTGSSPSKQNLDSNSNQNSTP